jgi:hypothetical protein
MGHRRPSDMEDISAPLLRTLTEIDYRKYLASQINVLPSLHDDPVIGCPGDHRITHNTLFCRLHSASFLEVFDVGKFIQVSPIVHRQHHTLVLTLRICTAGQKP